MVEEFVVDEVAHLGDHFFAVHHELEVVEDVLPELSHGGEGEGLVLGVEERDEYAVVLDVVIFGLLALGLGLLELDVELECGELAGRVEAEEPRRW